MKKLSAILLCACMLVGMFTACAKTNAPAASNNDKSSDTITIGISMPTYAEERWSVDETAMKAYCDELGIKYVTACAEGDSNKQKDQVSTMITQGIQALIIAPNDGNAAAAIVEECKEAGIYVISYDRMITGTSDLDMYITFDSWYQGQLQGKFIVDQLKEKYGEVKGNVVILHGDPGDSCAPLYYGGAYEQLKEYVDSGAINVISDNDCIGWNVAEATKHVENAMSIANSQGITIDAVLSPNDGLASGAIAALGDDLAKQTIITGMDCEVAACQRILAGTQSMTVFGDSREMGRVAVDVAAALVKDGSYKTDKTMEGTDADGNTIDVPAVLVTCEFVDANNMNIVIDSGYHTQEEIYGK